MSAAIAAPGQAKVFLRPDPIAPAEYGKPLPLGLIADLQICTSVMAEVAKIEFYKRNPKRKRIPQKFSERFLVRLDYEERSGNPKAPILLRDPYFHRPINEHFSNYLAAHQFDDEFSASRDLVISAIINTNLGRLVNESTPVSSLKRLGGIGNRPGNRGLVLSRDYQGSICEFTSETRRHFRKIANETSNKQIDETGIICAVDMYNKTFKLLTADKKIIPIKFRTELAPRIRSVFDNFIESKVSIRGNAKINYLGNIIIVDSIQDFEEGGGQPVLDMDARFAEIAAMEAGWFDGEGDIFSKEILDTSHNFVRGLKDLFSIPVPFIYPMPDGNIQIEWSQDQWEITLLLNFLDTTAEFFAYEKSKKLTKEMDLPLQEIPDLIDAVAELYNSLLFEGA